MKPIVLYLRVSTTEQNVDSQKEDLTRWCLNNDFEIKSIFGETVSGYDQTAERVQYDLMKQYVLDRNIKDIVVWEISRLSRSLVKTVTELEYFTKQGVNVHFRKENLESLSNNVTNQLLIAILSSMAQMERDTFIERGNRGRMSSAMAGKNIGMCSTLPYGYITGENKMLVINEEEAKVVKLIYDLALKGMTLFGIAQHLNSLGVPTRRTIQGKTRTIKNGTENPFSWKANSVKQIIWRSLNRGIRIFKGVEISVPAIVSNETWLKAQERFKDNTGYHNRTKYPYLFKSKMTCGKCGRTLVTFKDIKSTASYYRCTGINDPILKCNNGKYINSQMIDEHLYKAIFTHTYIDQILHREATPVLEMDLKRNQIGYFKSELEGLEGKQKRYQKLYTDGHIEYEEYTKEIASLKNQSTDLKNRINVLKNDIENMSQIDINEIIKTYKSTKDFDIKRDFVNKYINKIEINKVEVANVNWKTPLHKNEKIIYAEVTAFNYNTPIKVLMTPYSKNVIVSKGLQYLPEIDMIVDITKKS